MGVFVVVGGRCDKNSVWGNVLTNICKEFLQLCVLVRYLGS